MSLGQALAGVLVLAIVAAPLLYFTLPAVGTVSGSALDYSVTRETGGGIVLGVEPCRRVQEAVWSCEVYDDSNSGTATYRVRRDGRCWSAVKTASNEEEGRLPARATGCVGLRDQVRVFDRI